MHTCLKYPVILHNILYVYITLSLIQCYINYTTPRIPSYLYNKYKVQSIICMGYHGNNMEYGNNNFIYKGFMLGIRACKGCLKQV